MIESASTLDAVQRDKGPAAIDENMDDVRVEDSECEGIDEINHIIGLNGPEMNVTVRGET